MKTVGLLHHPKLSTSLPLAHEAQKLLEGLGARVWLSSTWDPEKAKTLLPGTELLVTFGGDGTILRAARMAYRHGIPILGVNLGKLGFLSEVAPSQLAESVPRWLNGEGWLEQRIMLEARLPRQGLSAESAREELVDDSHWDGGMVFQALNDVVVSRATVSRIIDVRATIDGADLAVYRADGLIVSTPTGSTGYSLAAGGPILYPEDRNIILTPIAPHLSFPRSVVLPPTAIVELNLQAARQASLSVDGQIDVALEAGDSILVRCSPHVVRFLRFRPRTYFTEALARLVLK
ncbi:MAG: NAD(+)/NADH kinase [Chloroflexota bacterium]|nr:MAG: NAD(+)/NADH kinase [Chloroflexota bacterium]